MCFGSDYDWAGNYRKPDLIAAENERQARLRAAKAAAAESARVGRVNQSKSAITDAFSEFNPEYFTNSAKTYTDKYNTDVANSYAGEKKKLTAGLATRGVLGSSVDINANKDLTRRYDAAKKSYGDTYNKWETGLKGDIANAQSDLNASLGTNPDPGAVTTSAQQRVAALKTGAPTYDTIGNVFASLVAPLMKAPAAPSGINSLAYMAPAGLNLAGVIQKQGSNGISLAGGSGSSSVIG